MPDFCNVLWVDNFFNCLLKKKEKRKIKVKIKSDNWKKMLAFKIIKNEHGSIELGKKIIGQISNK